MPEGALIWSVVGRGGGQSLLSHRVFAGDGPKNTGAAGCPQLAGWALAGRATVNQVEILNFCLDRNFADGQPQHFFDVRLDGAAGSAGIALPGSLRVDDVVRKPGVIHAGFSIGRLRILLGE